MNDSRTFRTAVQHGVLASASLWVVATTLLLRNDLPDLIVTNWTSTGPGEPTLPPFGFAAIMFGLVAGLGWLLLLLARNARRTDLARGAGAASHFLALFLAVIHFGVLRVNATAVDGAVSGIGAWVLIALAAGIVGAVIGWFVAPEGASEPLPVLQPERLDVRPGEAVVWTGRAVAGRWFLVVPLAMAAIGVVLAAQSEVGAAIALVLAGVLVVSLLRVQVVVGPAGIQLNTGPFGLLRAEVPLDEVTEVFAEEVDALAYGGWGYRWLPGVRAVTVRSGPALHVRREHKPDLVVTVDDAQRGAGVLLAHLERRGTAVS